MFKSTSVVKAKRKKSDRTFFTPHERKGERKRQKERSRERTRKRARKSKRERERGKLKERDRKKEKYMGYTAHYVHTLGIVDWI